MNLNVGDKVVIIQNGDGIGKLRYGTLKKIHEIVEVGIIEFDDGETGKEYLDRIAHANAPVEAAIEKSERPITPERFLTVTTEVANKEADKVDDGAGILRKAFTLFIAKVYAALLEEVSD